MPSFRHPPSAIRLGIAAALALACATASAQQYPTKPVRLVVPFTPGGSTDIVGRLVTQKLAEFWGQPFVMDHRPGAGGAIGAETVARAVPDGYTLLLTNPGPALHNAVLRKKPSYSLADFAPIVLVGITPNLIVANPKLPAANLKELIAYARANPGKINWASPGTGSNPHIALEVLKLATGIDVVHVPFKGAPQAFMDLVAGQVDAQYSSYISTEAYVKSGRLKVLGISGAKRLAALPETPTFREQGVEGVDSMLWIGFVTAAKTPRAVVATLNGGVNRALQMPDVRVRLEQLGLEIEGGTPEKFGSLIQAEARRLAPLARSGAVQIE
jgi:tripartite-type tricarboxylate transporter receptor subunit TctC